MQSKLVAFSAGLGELGQLMQAGRQGHSNCVLSATFSPNGDLIATASWDKTAKIWKSSDGSLLKTLQGHSDEVRSATFSPDGDLIATASEDNTAKIWKSSDGSLLKTLQGHSNDVRSATFSPNGDLIATASWDRTAKIWKSSDGSLLKTLQGHSDYVRSATFSPNGDLIATASDDKTAKIWKSSDGSLLKTLQGHSGSVFSATFSPNGDLIATASYDKTAKIWKSSDGSLLKTLQGHSDSVCSATFSPNGDLLATASWDYSAFLFECDIVNDSYRILRKIRSLELFEEITPWASVLSLIFQVISFNFSKSVPWNTAAIAPVRFTTYFAMLHIEDFQGSHAFYVSGKLFMMLLLAIDFVHAAFFEKLLLTSRICTPATERKLRGYFILGMSQFLFIPALQIFLEAVWCNSSAWETREEYKRSIELLMGECRSPRYWMFTVIIAIVLPFFVWAQIPFILAGGDAAIVTPMVMRQPKLWVKANQISQSQKIPHFLRQTADLTEDRYLNPALCSAVSELCLKLVVAVVSMMDFGPVSLLTSMAAVSLRWLVQLALPLYRNPSANIFLHGCKALMFWSYCAGWWVLDSFNGVKPVDRPAYPAVVFYLVSVCICCVTFTAMVIASIPRDTGLNQPLLQ